MLDGIYRTAITLCAGVAFYVTDVWMTKKYDRRRSSGGTATNVVAITRFMIIMSVLILQPVLWPGLGMQVDRWWGLAIQVVGVLFLVCGVGLNVWARSHLAEFYAQRGEVQENHRVVESGPYRYVRHPIFTAYFGIVTGLMLVNPSLATVPALVVTIRNFTRAAIRDEKLMREDVPGYEEYMERTPRFFPRLRR